MKVPPFDPPSRRRPRRLSPVLGAAALAAAGLFQLGVAPPAALAQFSVQGREFESQAEFVRTGRRCGTDEPSDFARQVSRLVQNAARQTAPGALRQPATVSVWFHVIHDGDAGKLAEGRLDRQIVALNEAYAGTGVTFEKAGVDRVDVSGDPARAGWFTMGHKTGVERAAKTALRNDPKKYLNFYTAELGGGLLGWATFPWELEYDPDMDGVVLLHSTLPMANGDSGETEPYGLGATATHECGHWVGLFHTFQGGCQSPGDEVDDTPAHLTNFGCPSPPPDSCGDAPGADPVANFMNYTDDACMSEFTPGQIERLKAMIAAFRSELLETAAGEEGTVDREITTLKSRTRELR